MKHWSEQGSHSLKRNTGNLKLHLLPASKHSLIVFTCRNSAGHYVLAVPGTFQYLWLWKGLLTLAFRKKNTAPGYYSLLSALRIEESVALNCFANRSRGWERCLVESLTSLGLEIMTTKSLSRKYLISAFKSKKKPGCIPNDCGEGRCDRALNC